MGPVITPLMNQVKRIPRGRPEKKKTIKPRVFTLDLVFRRQWQLSFFLFLKARLLLVSRFIRGPMTRAARSQSAMVVSGCGKWSNERGGKKIRIKSASYKQVARTVYIRDRQIRNLCSVIRQISRQRLYLTFT
jgi:hypothetical protein